MITDQFIVISMGGTAFRNQFIVLATYLHFYDVLVIIKKKKEYRYTNRKHKHRNCFDCCTKNTSCSNYYDVWMFCHPMRKYRVKHIIANCAQKLYRTTPFRPRATVFFQLAHTARRRGQTFRHRHRGSRFIDAGLRPSPYRDQLLHDHDLKVCRNSLPLLD